MNRKLLLGIAVAVGALVIVWGQSIVRGFAGGDDHAENAE